MAATSADSAQQPRAPVLLIDGRSGSGKTELASAIARELPHAQLLHLDSVFPGWDGLEAGSAHVHSVVLRHHRWRRWDWLANELAQWYDLDPARPLIIEGCGALSAENRLVAQFGLWVELEAVSRKRRALERDGAMFSPHWERWAAQEDAFIAREHPDFLADLTVRGDAPLLPLVAFVTDRLRALGF